jgi:hypothetical protein
MRLLLRRSPRLVSAVLLVTYVSACTSWKIQQGNAADIITRHKPTEARVILPGGKEERIQRPRIENDSLVGEHFIPKGQGGRWERRAIPADSVAAMSILRPNGGRTMLALAGVGLTVLVIAAVVTELGESSGGSGGSGGSSGFGGGYYTSCPLIYSWNGREWTLDSGTFGGAIMPILARTDVDNLDHLQAVDGRLRLRMANELNETDYVDAISILAVDHAADVTVAPASDGTVHTLGRLESPVSVMDDQGISALDRVAQVDGWNWESRPIVRDLSDDAAMRDGITLTFAKPRGVAAATLVVDGNNSPWAAYLIQEFVGAHGRSTQAWYDSVNASPAEARRLGARMASEGFLDVQLRIDGEWEHQDFIWEAGPEIVKRQVLRLDLSRVPGDSVEIRLESAPMFWLIDRVAVDFSPEQPVLAREIHPSRAVTHRGEDVLGKLGLIDRLYHVLETGDRTELTFEVPPVQQGMARSYLLRSHGWYHLSTPQSGVPDAALLDQVKHQALGISRAATARLNQVLHEQMEMGQ